MNIFKLILLLFSSFFIIPFFACTQANTDFDINLSNVFVLEKQKSKNMSKVKAEIDYEKIKVNGSFMLKIENSLISSKVNELYADVFVGNGYITIGKKFILSGQSYFYNPSNFINLTRYYKNTYPNNIKYFDIIGNNFIRYTKLLKGSSLSLYFYPDEKSGQIDITKDFYNQNMDISIDLFWQKKEGMKLGLNSSKLIGENTLIYTETAYTKMTVLNDYKMPNNIYFISGMQYTTTGGCSINAEYYYHNKRLTLNQVITAKGKIPANALQLMAFRGNILFFNIRDINLHPKTNLNFSYAKGVESNLNSFSPLLKIALNEYIDIYAKAQFDLNSNFQPNWLVGIKGVW